MEPRRERELSQIHIEQLVRDQWKVYEGLRHEMLQTDPNAFPPQAFADLQAPEEKWRKNIERGIILVAFDLNRPAGMVRGVIEGDKAIARNMYTRLTHRGQGVGRRLMEELIVRCSGMGVGLMELEVENTQTAALSMYQSFGFVETGRLTEADHFMITMQKPLKLEK